MGENLYTIGKTATLANLSVDQLRNYDRIGLLSPQERGENNYRYYTENQLEDILIIKELKDIGVPLKTIKRFLENGDLETARTTIEETLLMKREELYDLQKQYDALTDALISIERAISQKATAEIQANVKSDSRFSIIPISERPIIYLRRKSKCYKTNHYVERYVELQNLIKKADIDTGRSWFILYHDPYQCIFDWGESAKGDMEFFANVKRGYSGNNPSCRIFGGFLAARATFCGPYDSISHKSTYEELMSWISALGYHSRGISYQELVVGRNTTNNPEEFVTNIYIPLNVDSI